MEHLWAPWRLAYVAREGPPKSGDDCFICRGLAEADDRKNLVAQRTGLGAVILNRFPYNNGHLLVAPKAHKGRLDELTAEESADLQRTLARLVATLERLSSPRASTSALTWARLPEPACRAICTGTLFPAGMGTRTI